MTSKAYNLFTVQLMCSLQHSLQNLFTWISLLQGWPTPSNTDRNQRARPEPVASVWPLLAALPNIVILQVDHPSHHQASWYWVDNDLLCVGATPCIEYQWHTGGIGVNAQYCTSKIIVIITSGNPVTVLIIFKSEALNSKEFCVQSTRYWFTSFKFLKRPTWNLSL